MRALGAVVGFVLLGAACTPHPEGAKQPGAPSASSSAAASDAPRGPESAAATNDAEAWPSVPEVPADADPSTVTVELRGDAYFMDGVLVAGDGQRTWTRVWRYLDQRAMPSVRGTLPGLVLRLPPEASAKQLTSLTSIAGFCGYRRLRVEITTGTAAQFLLPQPPADPKAGDKERSIYIWGDGPDTRITWLKRATPEGAKPYQEVVARPGSSGVRDTLRRKCRPRRSCASAVLEVDPAASAESVAGLVQAVATIATDDWGPLVVVIPRWPREEKKPHFFIPHVRVSGSMPFALMDEAMRGTRGELGNCVAATLDRAPNAVGRVTLQGVVAADGRVKSVSVLESSDHPDPGFADCLRRFYEKVRFPPSKIDGWTFTTGLGTGKPVPAPAPTP